MSYLYVCEQGAVISITANRFEVKYKNGLLKSIPAETLEMIEVFGKVQLTTQCIEACLCRGINVVFYSTAGAYYGRLISTSHVNVQKQRMQAALNQKVSFKIEFSKKIIDAKIRNQIVLLRRYARRTDIPIERSVKEMQYMCGKVYQADTVEQIMGYEGYAARIYFKMLGQLIDKEFAFTGRSRRPPKDPFNSLISLGYSIMLNEIYGKLEAKGLNPYFGLMHKDREKHPTLASDLMEEWRAVLIDSVALSMINGHELQKEDFYEKEEGVYLSRDGMKKYLQKLENKFRTQTKYLCYVDYSVSFRQALELQVSQLVKAMQEEDSTLYHPILIR